ncbi:MAG: hypothetical protein K2L75_00535 [Muribaculaceae bacterium]|nr:hypothetical protein [Muribaculaceae bacterium]MDE6525715.1 hypothetical protein [Muribaculaceae bacterium]MDE6611479.1 hypothetical protein [Muribaculaceae bacterium]
MKALPTALSRLLVITALALSALLCPATAEAAAKAPVWEVVTSVDNDSAQMPISDDSSAGRLDVAVHDSFIYITVDQPIKIEVFTILGQLVTSKNIAPGTVRLTLGTRGIYIIKGAGSTRRVNL